MSKGNDVPRLSKRYAFVKRRLLRLPEQSYGVEVDFCPLPDVVPDEDGFWLGLVVDHGNATILMTAVLDRPPSAEDAADIMARALELSHFQDPCRPDKLLLRDNPTWEALHPWLEQLSIEAVVTEDLLNWDTKAGELKEWMRKRWSPLPDFRTEMHEEFGHTTLDELRGLAYGFLYFEQPKGQ